MTYDCPGTFIADIFPPDIRDKLVDAAARARDLPQDSVERKEIIEEAVRYALVYAPQYFRPSAWL